MTADSMGKGCRIEENEQRSEEKHYVRLGERILESEGRILAATGSLSCLRALYMTAERIQALDRFCFCILSEAEYATGQAENRLQEMLQYALREKPCDGIVVYASCLEVITRLDFSHLLKKLENPHHVPVQVLFRGPMVRRYRNPPEELEKLLENIPVTSRSAAGGLPLLPPPMPDFEAVSGVLQAYPVYRILISGGGCDGCIEKSPLCGDDYRLRKTRLNDLEVAAGCESSICAGIGRDWTACGKGALCCLLGSAMPAAVGMDFRRILAGLTKTGIPAVYFPTDGFHSAQEGLGEFYKALEERVLQAPGEAENDAETSPCMGILGAHLYAAASREKIAHGLEHLDWDGYSYMFPEDVLKEEPSARSCPAANWVVTAEGIPAAEYMREKKGIPYIAGVPVGMRGMVQWRREIARLLGGKTDGIPEEPTPVPARGDAPAVLLEGDPLLTQGVSAWLRDMCGITQTVRCVYAPVKTQASWYRSVLRQADQAMPGRNFRDVQYVADEKAWEQLVRAADLVIADAVLACSLPDTVRKKVRWIDLPNPVLSHGIRTALPEYTIFGKKGAAWLQSRMEDGCCL